MNNQPFLAEGCDISAAADNLVKLEFIGPNDERQEVLIDKSMLLPIVASLQRRIEHGQVVPMTARGLRPGAIRVDSHSIGPNPHPKEGGAVLTLHVLIAEEQRGVSIPLTLPQKDLRTLISDLGAYAS